MSDCPFCNRIAAHHYDDEDHYTVAFRPLKPVTPGHWLVVPKIHIEHALAGPDIAGDTLRFAAQFAYRNALGACNFITSAGEAATQTVRHLHVHIVPRRLGDGLALPWTGQTRESA